MKEILREGIYGSSLPGVIEPFNLRIYHDQMLERMASEHQMRIEAVRMSDGTVPEMIYPDPLSRNALLSGDKLRKHIDDMRDKGHDI